VTAEEASKTGLREFFESHARLNESENGYVEQSLRPVDC